ncbi:hypothetical protein AB6A40_002547 [Gnathostoma spinigerum]|uniref:Sister chromatid cohesion protein DCC1 n=1 Tax=Gnathostoma spinigerum TaxID=75299 RepID=A0ABD6EFY3_9BILA
MEKFLTRSERIKPPCKKETSVDEKPVRGTKDLSKITPVKEVDDFFSNLDGNVEQVSAYLDVAKMSDVKGEVQQIKFQSNFCGDDFHLLEVNDDMANKFLAGEKFMFRGDLDDFTVLCTASRTYHVFEVETSDTLLVLPSLHLDEEVCRENRCLVSQEVIAKKSHYLELREVMVPSMSRLREMLRESELEWTENEETPSSIKSERKLYTRGDLLEVVPMSERELDVHLAQIPVICLEGFVRLLSSEYRDRLLNDLIECIDDESLPDIRFDFVSLDAFMEHLKKTHPSQNIPVEAAERFLEINGKKILDIQAASYSLDERSVCRARISQLLRAAVRFEYSAFEKMLSQLLPEGIEMKTEYFDGLALVEETLATGKTIRYFNVEDLPESEDERLKLLFTVRPKWEHDAIALYLIDICPTSRAVNETLTKHCRHETVNGRRIYCGLR